jgi:23S rRNA pseudouridine1911/1915/1917 synthase
MTQTIQLQLTVPDEMRGRRLDQALAELVQEYSRSRLQQWIRAGQVSLDERIPQVRERLHGGETVCINATIEAQTRSGPEDIPLQVVHADADLLVINKPAGLVVHPAAGNPAGTLLNALLHFDPDLAGLPRAGIVHRLDKATSGLMVVARNLTAHKSLVDALQERLVKREYLAVVQTVLTAGGSVDAPIGRHPVDRKRMAVVPGGKESLTHYRVEERFRAHTLVRVQLETGRTHQIRVHMAHQHIPIVGDPVYGGRLRLPPGASTGLQEQLAGFRRQALHAARLTLTHPSSGEIVSWSAPLPDDMTRLIEALRADAQQHAHA